MKKILAIALSVIMIVGIMAACGDNKGTASKSGGGTEVKVTKDGKINLEIKYETIGEESKKTEPKVGTGKHVQSINIADEDKVIYIEAGKVGNIKSSVVPSDAADPSIYYQSENTNVAKVDKDGKVLGVEAGSTTVKLLTNDRNFRADVTVVVYRVANDDAKINDMLKLINDARKEAGLSELPTDNVLTAAATERAFEEAAEGDNKMDDTRVLKDADGKYKEHKSVYTDYNIFARGTTRIYAWGEYKDAKAAFDAIMKSEDNKSTILCEDGKYTDIGLGCFENKGCTYWCIMMYLR